MFVCRQLLLLTRYSTCLQKGSTHRKIWGVQLKVLKELKKNVTSSGSPELYLALVGAGIIITDDFQFKFLRYFRSGKRKCFLEEVLGM